MHKKCLAVANRLACAQSCVATTDQRFGNAVERPSSCPSSNVAAAESVAHRETEVEMPDEDVSAEVTIPTVETEPPQAMSDAQVLQLHAVESTGCRPVDGTEALKSAA